MSVEADNAANKTAVYRLLGLQIVITFAAACLLLIMSGKVMAYSAFLGGLVYILPNAWFFRHAFRDSVQMPPQRVLSRLYTGEAGKLALTGVLFALSFALVREIHAGALFMTFMVMIIVNLAGLAQLGLKN